MCEKIKIKRNQIWRKKDTGQMVVICSKNSGENWNTMRIKAGAMVSSKKKAHHIKSHDLLKYYELMDQKGGDCV